MDLSSGSPYCERLKGGGHSIHKKRLTFFTIDNGEDSKGGRRWPSTANDLSRSHFSIRIKRLFIKFHTRKKVLAFLTAFLGASFTRSTKGFLLPVVVASAVILILFFLLEACLQSSSGILAYLLTESLTPVFQCLNPGSEELRAARANICHTHAGAISILRLVLDSPILLTGTGRPMGRYEWEGQERTTNNAIQCRHRKPSREEAIRGSIARPVLQSLKSISIRVRLDLPGDCQGKDLIVTFLLWQDRLGED
uniref:Uncharacterized protein n=1 Tax=Salix viminalis TaxID=40686 RepID=A0A6N2NGK4_SALVM